MKITRWIKSVLHLEPDVVWFATDEEVHYIDRKEISSISTTNISSLYFIPTIMKVILSMKSGKEFNWSLTVQQYQIFHRLFIKYSGRPSPTVQRLGYQDTTRVWTND